MSALDTDLLATLRALEVELHRPAARSDARRLDALLHAEFREYGRSGRSYSRADIFAHLLAAPSHATVVADRFTLRQLAPDVALLTYRSAHRGDDGALERHTLRASIWQRGRDGWQMSFHQGTPTGPFEPEP
jgi:hypothetical protein